MFRALVVAMAACAAFDLLLLDGTYTHAAQTSTVAILHRMFGYW